MQPNATPSVKSAAKPFVENWLQSLTLVSGDPNAQRIKPMMDGINQLCRNEPNVDRGPVADKLWEFCSSEGLVKLLDEIPTQQVEWSFEEDDCFAFERTNIQPISDLQAFKKGIGVEPATFPTKARVTSGDWTNLVRNEALRQRRSMNVTVFPDGKNLELASTANWDGKHWSFGFEQVDWVSVVHEDPFRTKRPSMESNSEAVLWTAAAVDEALLPKLVAKLTQPAIVDPWFDCVPRLKSLHQRVLIDDAENFSPWFRRAWRIVWPVSYREQNVLRGLIELDHARQELAACITSIPRLTLGLFVLAKLVYLSQAGRGLSPIGDFVDEIG